MEDPRSQVDTSRPFRSVKEAVAVFGERLLSGDLSSKPVLPSPFSCSFTSVPVAVEEKHDTMHVMRNVKRLELELEDTKRDLMLLKERASEMEVVIASMSVEVRKNGNDISMINAKTNSGGLSRERSMGMDYLPSLAEVLSLGEIGSEIEERERRRRKKKDMSMAKKKKKKPIVPLVGDMIVLGRRKNKGLHSEELSRQSFYSMQMSGII